MASAAPPAESLAAHCRAIAERARRAAVELAGIPGDRRAAALRAAAARIRADAAEILAANANDVAAAPGYGLTPGDTSEAGAYGCLLGRASEERRGFHTSDALLVEQMIAKLQEHYRLQRQY